MTCCASGMTRCRTISIVCSTESQNSFKVPHPRGEKCRATSPIGRDPLTGDGHSAPMAGQGTNGFTRIERHLARLGVFLFLAVLALPVIAGPPAADKTEVIEFRPRMPGGSSRRGECWTESIAASRAGAWRCMVDNEIYDPCFSRRDLSNAVICDANPAKATAGFILKLSKPLPEQSSNVAVYSRPWLVKLADGATCEIETGTVALVAGLQVPYNCSDSQECGDKGCAHLTGLTGNFRHGKLWMANKVTFSSSDKGLQLISRKPVAVIAVWK